MPSSLKNYNSKERALKFRNKSRQKNYEIGRQYQITENKWKDWEIYLLFNYDKTDRELGKLLGRSVQAIQVKRCKTHVLREFIFY